MTEYYVFKISGEGIICPFLAKQIMYEPARFLHYEFMNNNTWGCPQQSSKRLCIIYV